MAIFPQFNGKRILITGASSGIGASLVTALQASGATLIINGRSLERLQALAHPHTTIIAGDLTDPNTHQKIATAIETIGGLDIAILNAGTNWYIEPGTFSATDVKTLMIHNYHTMADNIGYCLPHLLKSKGQLVMMASIAGYGGLPRAGAYNASKAAIRILAQSLDLDLRPKGVPVTCVCPGFVKTPLTDKNDFPMPFLLTPEEATRRILTGIANKAHEVNFPKRLSLLLKLATSLPASWQYHLLRITTTRNA